MTTLFVCGDIVNYNNKDGMICSNSLSNLISAADYSVCNFEAPVFGYGTPQPKSGRHHHQRYETVKGLKQQGFNLFLFANNHIMDYGEEGLSATINCAINNGIDVLGAGLNFEQAYRPIIKNFHGMKIGMINACESQFGVLDYFRGTNTCGYAWINHTYIDKMVIDLKKECEFLILFAHAGLEGYPIPQKEWRIRYQHLCNLGVDVVAGSHPHVPQGFEVYGDSLIFYSLGNFYFDSKNFENKHNSSFSILLNFETGKKPFFSPVYHSKIDNLVQLERREEIVDLDNLCEILTQNYEIALDKISIQSYEWILQNHVNTVGKLYCENKLKRKIKQILNKDKLSIDEIFLQLHLIRNESYYYAAKRALELKSVGI